MSEEIYGWFIKGIIGILLGLEGYMLLENKRSMVWTTIRYQLRPPAHPGGIRAILSYTIQYALFIATAIWMGSGTFPWFEQAYLANDLTTAIGGVIIFLNTLYLLQ